MVVFSPFLPPFCGARTEGKGGLRRGCECSSRTQGKE